MTPRPAGGRRRPGAPAGQPWCRPPSAGCRRARCRARGGRDARRAPGTLCGVDIPKSRRSASTHSNVPFARAALSWSPRPVPTAVPPSSANGTSAPSRAASARGVVAALRSVPQRASHARQSGSGISGAAAHPTGDGHVLPRSRSSHASLVPEGCAAGECLGRADRQVAGAVGYAGGTSTEARERNA